MPRPRREPTTAEIAANAEFPVEAKLQSKMMRALKDLGFDLRYHAWRADEHHDLAGFLDVIAINTRAGLLYTAELKGPTGAVSKEQREWIAGWKAVRRIHTAGVIYPVDYSNALDDLRLLLGNVGGK